MLTAKYLDQQALWPATGRHLLAQYDADSIYVYQAYRPSIASHAVAHQRFGGDFSYNRMSWLKPNFLWMMYRAGWAQKEGQERILAVQLHRRFFDELLRTAVLSSFDPLRHESRDAWQRAVASSDVRLQWDPDHDPAGRALARRAIQLGLRRDALRRYGEREVISISDITDFVAEQREHLRDDFGSLLTPVEKVYVPEASAAKAVGLD